MPTILIVDDREMNREYLAAILADPSRRLIEADGGESALVMVRSERPDLVIADVQMPGMDGYQLVRALRAEPRIAGTRVIFLSAKYRDAEARRLARECGVSRFFEKPIEPQVLIDEVEAVLGEQPTAFNAMPATGPELAERHVRLVTDKLHEHVRSLEDLNRHLEQRVAVRTLQLERTKEALEAEIGRRRDVEEALRRANQRLSEEVTRDPLTGLYNRRYLDETLEREFSRARRTGGPIGVLMIDLDHFKRVNDTYGHAVGDTVLLAAARCMHGLSRSEDILCRYGGEEFVLVMGNAPEAIVHERAESIRRAIEGLSRAEDGPGVGPLSVSIGVALYSKHGATAAEVLQAADSAVYNAKADGRNCVVMAGRESTFGQLPPHEGSEPAEPAGAPSTRRDDWR